MEKTAINRIIENMDEVFRGDAWHGPSVLETLNGLGPNSVFIKKDFASHSIAEHVYHINAFKIFLLEKLKGNFKFDIQSEEENWGNNLDDWQTLLNELKQTHHSILDILEQQTDTLLTKTVPGCDFDFYKLLNGVIQHDVYHLGMIWVLWE